MTTDRTAFEESKYLIIYNDIDISEGIPFDLGSWMIEQPVGDDLVSISKHFKDIIGPFELAPKQELIFIEKEKGRVSYKQGLKPEEYRYLVVKPKKETQQATRESNEKKQREESEKQEEKGKKGTGDRVDW